MQTMKLIKNQIILDNMKSYLEELSFLPNYETIVYGVEQLSENLESLQCSQQIIPRKKETEIFFTIYHLNLPSNSLLDFSNAMDSSMRVVIKLRSSQIASINVDYQECLFESEIEKNFWVFVNEQVRFLNNHVCEVKSVDEPMILGGIKRSYVLKKSYYYDKNFWCSKDILCLNNGNRVLLSKKYTLANETNISSVSPVTVEYQFDNPRKVIKTTEEVYINPAYYENRVEEESMSSHRFEKNFKGKVTRARKLGYSSLKED